MKNSRPFLGENCVTPGGPGRVLERWIWTLVQSTLFRWSPRPLHRWRTWLLRCFGATVAPAGRVVVYPTARIAYPRNLVLEDRAMIGPAVTIYNLGVVTLRYGANLSQGCHLCAGTHDFNRWDMPLVTGPITIGSNAWLAAEVFVGPSVEIGELSVVGARSVVMHDLPARMICVGCPCKPIKPRPEPLTSPSS